MPKQPGVWRAGSQIESSRHVSRSSSSKEATESPESATDLVLTPLKMARATGGIESRKSMSQKMGSASLMRQSSRMALLLSPPAALRRMTPATDHGGGAEAARRGVEGRGITQADRTPEVMKQARWIAPGMGYEGGAVAESRGGRGKRLPRVTRT